MKGKAIVIALVFLAGTKLNSDSGTNTLIVVSADNLKISSDMSKEN